MEIALNLYKVINKYKELLASLEGERLSFNEAIILYAISMGITEKKEIVSFLEKDRSQIHRLLKQMVADGVLFKSSNTFNLTDKGHDIYKKIEFINNTLYSAKEYGELKALKKNLLSFDSAISSMV
jgi:predicted transcriptional regulator